MTMRTLDAHLTDDYDAIAFVRQCRREQPLRDAGRAKREADEAAKARQAPQVSESNPFSEEQLAIFL